MSLLTLLCCILICNTISTQVIWDGPDMTFSKAAFSDPTDAQNQDRITDLVWITRGNTQGIYNAKTESGYIFGSPEGTEWAQGTTEDIGSLNFEPWESAIESNPPGSLNQDLVLHLIEEDIYIDIVFTQWGQMQAGGGSFSYRRSTQPTSAVHSIIEQGRIIISPNPASSWIKLENMDITGSYNIYSVDGIVQVIEGYNTKSGEIDISSLPTGLYILSFEGRVAARFMKI